ncbi:hypothetical protein QBC36DRAFT_68346 [Triangularia setosa]|uniref:Ubiquitin-like domain-containing protein n=1 Tax=Triangularia setosa TaxID=2587417 RepID=A0AAN6W0I9_9PEZI|nr:hypothetical protein QBC36DRAFT_68346 [Podospora setosa]
MSFGYAIGDFIAGAGMAHKLIRLMATSSDACSEYQDAMKELRLIQQAFINVSQISQTDVALPRDTVNSASFLVMSSMDTISKFLQRTEHLKKSLSASGPPAIRDSWCKVGWALYGKDELKELRDRLHSSLTALNLLFSAANYSCRPVPASIAQFQVLDNEGYSSGTMSETTCVDLEVVDLIQADMSLKALPKPVKSVVQPRKGVKGLKSKSKLLKPAPPALEGRDDQATQDAEATLLERLAHLEKMAEDKTNWEARQAEWRKNVEDLAQLKAEIKIQNAEIALRSQLEAEKKLAEQEKTSRKNNDPISLKDAVGRKFNFPFDLCKTWQGMSDLIKQAFLHIEVLGPHVHQGRYDLISPSGEIILPTLWEKTIEPGWAVTMHMWPMDPLSHRSSGVGSVHQGPGPLGGPTQRPPPPSQGTSFRPPTRPGNGMMPPASVGPRPGLSGPWTHPPPPNMPAPGQQGPYPKFSTNQPQRPVELSPSIARQMINTPFVPPPLPPGWPPSPPRPRSLPGLGQQSEQHSSRSIPPPPPPPPSWPPSSMMIATPRPSRATPRKSSAKQPSTVLEWMRSSKKGNRNHGLRISYTSSSSSGERGEDETNSESDGAEADTEFDQHSASTDNETESDGDDEEQEGEASSQSPATSPCPSLNKLRLSVSSGTSLVTSTCEVTTDIMGSEK